MITTAAAALLAACGAPGLPEDDPGRSTAAAPTQAPAIAAAVAAGPDLASCPKREPVDEGVRQRTDAIAVPAALRELVRADVENIAILTLEGATVCVDASWMDSIDHLALSADKRFVSFDWVGYEAFGHVIVDRSGKGSTVDTGVPPVASPSGALLAAADLSESSYGALSAFAVWRIEPAGLRLIGKQDVSPPAVDWRIERWVGETCIDLSGVPIDSESDAEPPRERFRALEGSGWRIESGRCPAQ
ncbi:MAG TPA: hypothetical protein VFS49_12645 [Croceibacterium sp.]|nr:hypothetical protein [Croceibacterium sp.]